MIVRNKALRWAMLMFGYRTTIDITDKGRRILAGSGEVSLSADERLMLELMGRAPGADVEDLIRVADELADRFGNDAAALDALQNGKIELSVEYP